MLRWRRIAPTSSVIGSLRVSLAAWSNVTTVSVSQGSTPLLFRLSIIDTDKWTEYTNQAATVSISSFGPFQPQALEQWSRLMAERLVQSA